MNDSQPVDRLKYRSSYYTKDGTKINVWSDPREPELETFDHTVICPTVWVQGNGWLFTPEGLKHSAPQEERKKKPRKRVEYEREDRENMGSWGLQEVP